MNTSYDKFGQPEIPYIILCNPNKEELFSLSLAYDTEFTIRFNGISEFSFTYPKTINFGETVLEAYEYIKNKRLVRVEGYGYFQIVSSPESLDGATPIKKIKCESLEVELISKRLVAYGGTKPLWNPLSPEGTVLNDMIALAPNWSINHVDVELLTAYRTFNIADSNVYNFLINDVSKAYECVFVFDTETRQINAYSITNATSNTDIFLSFDNIMSTAELDEKSDEITTVLAVYGGGNLNIRNVNPLGTDKIYDFSYYSSSEWMSSSLITAINNWKILVDTQQPIYSDNLLLLQTYNEELLSLQSQLANLNSEYLSLEGIKVVRIQAGEDYADINIALDNKQVEIDNQETLISNKELQITETTTTLTEINSLVSFEANFTPSQLLELNNFMFENTYKNENIIQTDSMNQVEIQSASQSLYNQAKNVLGRISQPRYEFSLEAVNYTVLKEFSIFTAQSDVGKIVVAEIKDGVYINTVLLEIKFQLDNPENFELTFSNRLRLDNGGFTYSDLMGQVVKTGSSVAFDSLKWSNWENDYKNTVTSFISSSLNASVNNLISNSNQDITITQNGLRARQWNGSSYDSKQMWMVNNMLAFSDDGFQTAKLALGEITLPAGGTAYGLVADVIVGRLLAGNTLTIANSSNNFVLDESGATLNNAKFSIQTTNTKIIIDPTQNNSFAIQKNEGGTFNNKFWVDNSGNVNFSGNLTGATGTFSGTLSASIGNIGTLIIDSSGLKTPDGQNYIRGNGDLKWGGLSISGGTAVFTGDIYANRIVGQIVNTQISDGAISDSKILYGVNAGKITAGTMSGSRIYGGTAYIDGIASVSGTLFVQGNLQAYNNVTFFGSSVVIGSSTNLYAGGLGNLGQTIGYAVQTPYGTRYLYFTKGILTGYT